MRIFEILFEDNEVFSALFDDQSKINNILVRVNEMFSKFNNTIKEVITATDFNDLLRELLPENMQELGKLIFDNDFATVWDVREKAKRYKFRDAIQMTIAKEFADLLDADKNNVELRHGYMLNSTHFQTFLESPSAQECDKNEEFQIQTEPNEEIMALVKMLEELDFEKTTSLFDKFGEN